MELGQGWREVERLETSHVLLYQRCQGRVCEWAVLDPARPEGTTEFAEAHGLTSAVSYDAVLGEILVPMGAKVWRLSLAARRSTEAVVLDEEVDHISWASAVSGAGGDILYVACKRSPTRSEVNRLFAQERKPGFSVSMHESDFRLTRFGGGASKELCRFPDSAKGVVADWARNRLYCWGEHSTLLSVDLASGEIESRELKGYNGLALSPSGEPVVWSWSSGGISAVGQNGELKLLNRSGSYPSFSEKGDIAFVGPERSLWVKAGAGEEEWIVRGGGETAHNVSWPSWCGQVVAAEIPGYRKQVLTVVADLARREVVAIPRSHHLALIWVAREKLGLRSEREDD